MFAEDLKASDIPFYLAFAKDRKLLRDIWQSSDDTRTFTILALDLEKSSRDRGELNYITELGLSSQPTRENSKRVTRHILVDSNQDKKGRSGFTPPGFGVRSEHVGQQDDLYHLLEDVVKDHNPPKHEVVLTGFAMHNDLSILFRTINWLPPLDMHVIDAQHIWASFFLPPNPRGRLPSLKDALANFEIPLDPLASPHNPANDAWYSIELFVRRAEQAVGPVVIRVPPFKTRVQPIAAPATNIPAPTIPPWVSATCKTATPNGSRRKSWSSTTVSNNPNLIPLNPTQDRLSRKRKLGDRDEEDGPSTPVATASDRENESSNDRSKRAFNNNNKLQAVGGGTQATESEGGEASGTEGEKGKPEAPWGPI